MVFAWLNDQPSSIAFRQSIAVYPSVLTMHVVSMCLFAGLIIMMDLRLLGVGNLRTPVTQVQKRLFPWQMLGLGVSTFTGVALFFGEPMRFYGNVFFWIKMVMMAVSGVNAMAFHVSTYHSVAAWDADAPTPLAAKVSSAASLVLWTGIIISGRLIAYDWFSATMGRS